MFGHEERTILPREDESDARPRYMHNGSDAVVGTDMLARAQQRAMACAPDAIRSYASTMGQDCARGGGVSGDCGDYPISRVTQNTGASGTTFALTYSFQRPFKGAKLTLPSAKADDFTFSSIKVAGEELLRNGSINGGPFSSGNEESGGELDMPWVYPGQNIVLTGTVGTAFAAANAVTIAGIER